MVQVESGIGNFYKFGTAFPLGFGYRKAAVSMKQLIVFLCLSVLPVIGYGDSTVVTSSDIEDTYIASSTSAANNYGATNVLQVNSYTVRGVLIRITNGHLATLLGSNKVIDSAFLTAVVGNAPTSASRIVHIFKCLRDWKEGTLNGGDATGLQMANWNQYDYDVEIPAAYSWGTSGCQNTTTDRTTPQMDSVTVATTDAGVTKRWRLDTTMVRGWYAGTMLGGVVLKASSSNLFDFHSTEATTSSNRPTFVVYYHDANLEESRKRLAGGSTRARMRSGQIARRHP
jgi:hypothetical protein